MKDKRWRDYHNTILLPSIVENGKRTKILYEKYEKLIFYTRVALLKTSFRAWKHVTIRFMTRDVVERVDRMDAGYYSSKKKNVFHALSAISLGASSKKILQRRKDGLARARSNLTMILAKKNQRRGIITNEMVQTELRRIVHADLSYWNRRRILSDCIVSWKEVLEKSNEMNNMASRHLKGNIFRKWRCWTVTQVALISDDDNKSCYNVEIEAFRKKWLEFQPFREWRLKAYVYAQSRRMRRRIISLWMSKQLCEWRAITSRSRESKIIVLRNWMEYKLISVGKPFLAWRDEVYSMKQLRQHRDRFIYSYNRMKLRRQLHRLFRTWKQQALYGRVTSMFSRQQLIEQLAVTTRKIECLDTNIVFCTK